MSDKPFRILVTGSRDWDDWEAIETALDDTMSAYPSLIVVHGACPTGADAMAASWVVRYQQWPWLDHEAVAEPHPADWKGHGKAAGPKRNAEMVAAGADLCLAFIRNGSRGASHTAGLAEKAGIETRRFTA